MSIGIIGKKLGMTQIFDVRGHLVPVTVVQAGPCQVVQVKTVEKDGYSAVQLGFGKASRRRAAKKPLKGHFKSANANPAAVLKEFRLDEDHGLSSGDIVTVDHFKVSDSITITGTSKGRGFAGVMKRHGFAGKDAGHGVHEAFRHGGSIGCRTPKRTIKGMKMAGRMGNRKVTIRTAEIIYVDKENNLLLIKGPVPGWNGGYLFIRKNDK